MTSAGSPHSGTRAGWPIGLLLLLQLAGLIGPFAMLHPVTRGAEDYLAHAAASTVQLRIAAFLLLANCALTIVISIAAARIVRPRSESAAIALIVASVFMLVMQAVDNVGILSMLSLSQRYGAAGAGNELLLTLATVVGTGRRWAHMTELLAIDLWIGALYVILYRFRLVPRAVAVFGLVTVLLHVTGIPLRGFLGYGIVTLMGVPMAFSHVTTGTWLAVRGFPRHVARA